jgi:hypothetical protein
MQIGAPSKGETKMKAQVEPVTLKRGRGRPKNPNPPAPVQLRIPRFLYNEIKQQAALETLPAAAWIRQVCVQALRKRKRKSA